MIVSWSISCLGFVVLTSFIPKAWSIPYSEKHAFCIDRSFANYHNMDYLAQKKYNNCMKNAEQLIINYEEKNRRKAIEYQKYLEEQEVKREQKQREDDALFEEVFGGYNLHQ